MSRKGGKGSGGAEAQLLERLLLSAAQAPTAPSPPLLPPAASPGGLGGRGRVRSGEGRVKSWKGGKGWKDHERAEAQLPVGLLCQLRKHPQRCRCLCCPQPLHLVG